MKTTKLPRQITISCARDEDVGRLVLAAAEGEGAKLRKLLHHCVHRRQDVAAEYPVSGRRGSVGPAGLGQIAADPPRSQPSADRRAHRQRDRRQRRAEGRRLGFGGQRPCDRNRRQLRQRLPLAGEHRSERPEDGIRRGRRKSPSQRAVLHRPALRRASGDARRGVVRGAVGPTTKRVPGWWLPPPLNQSRYRP